ncbi:MAG: exopolysaccharide biosynthesis protein [Bacteroidia bacterium]|jgi:exopolysaccharide biosynthesis protein
MASLVNNIIDKLLSVAWRLMDLPVYLLVLLIAILFIPAILIWSKTISKKEKVGFKTMTIALLGILIPMALIVDLKLKSQDSEIEILSEKYMNSLNAEVSITGSEKVISLDTKTLLESYMIDLNIWERQIHEAITLVTFKKEAPKASFFLAIVDLTYPGLEPKITLEYTEWKTLTSEFAKANDCILAINGEAGDGIFQNSGYGEWVGNWVSEGKPITMLDSDQRPFLSFNKYNKATYSPEKEVITEHSEEMYNAIWGRWDLLVDGKFPEFENQRIYPQCVMGIDESGDKLYLLIVDGKREEYSKGLSFEECAKLLKELGCHNAMACDQGGSVCMYVEPMKGIINRPADNDGEERVVYTHFGIKVP